MRCTATLIVYCHFSTHTGHCGGIIIESVWTRPADVRNQPCWFRGGGHPWRCFQKWFRGAGWVSGLGLASSSEWELMKTNDLTRSKGWDQGWGILRPSQFPTWEINEGREQPSLCIIYSLRPLNPMSVVCCPPVGLLGPYDTRPEGITPDSRLLQLLCPVQSTDRRTLCCWPKAS